MKKLIVSVALVALAVALPVFAADLKFNANTGDLSLDNFLKDLNVEAEADIGDFKASMKAEFGEDEPKIELMIEKEKMSPADVYMALKVSNITEKPLDTVIEEFRRNRDKGWGVIAKNLGIKPGSPEFHALKGKEKKGGHGKGHGKGRK